MVGMLLVRGMAERVGEVLVGGGGVVGILGWVWC